MSSPRQFNDELDMNNRPAQFMASDYEVVKERMIQIKLSQNFGMSREAAEMETWLALGPAGLYHGIRHGDKGLRLFDEVLRDSGVISFGKSSKNDHLWAHYAGEGSGFCIGFEAKKLGPHPIRDVQYCSLDNMERLKYFEMNREQILLWTCLTKDTKWSAEQEARLILVNRANSDLVFSPEAIVEVVAGDKMDKPSLDRMQRIVEQKYRCASLYNRAIM